MISKKAFVLLGVCVCAWLMPHSNVVGKPRRGAAKKAKRAKGAVRGKSISSKSKRQQAAGFFSRGQTLYFKGQFRAAIDAFKKAHQLAPHPAAVFNIARCYENLGRADAALRFYRKVLETSKDPAQKNDVRARIRRLRRRPSKVFVSSQPPGVAVTVDGNGQPEKRRTPLVVDLPPGGHVLLFRMEGYLLAARRVDVRVGKETTVHVVLKAKPKPKKPCPVCVKCAKCADPRLLSFSGLHLHLSPFASFAFLEGTGLVGGPGLQLHATIGRLRLGASLLFAPANPANFTAAAEKVDSAFWLSFLEGGWVFQLGRYHVFPMVGVGIHLNRLTEVDPGTDGRDAKEALGFAWHLGVGIEVTASRWVSIGAAIRAGLWHGKVFEEDSNLKKTEPLDNFTTGNDDPPHPFVALSGFVTIHL